MRVAFVQGDPQEFLDIRFFDVLGKAKPPEKEGRENESKERKVVLVVAGDSHLPLALRGTGRGQGDPFPSLGTMKM
jgi:hypothetical protein